MNSGVRLVALPYALKGLQFAALAGAAALLWVSVSGLAGGFPDIVVPPFDAAGSARAGVELAQYRVIGDRDVFKSRATQAAPVVETPVAPSRLEVRLLGTVVADRASDSVAVVRYPSSSDEIVQVKIGDLVAAGRVVRIEHRRMVLDHAGRLESVEFEQPAAGVRRLPRASGASAASLRGEVNRLRMLNSQRRAVAAAAAPGRVSPGTPGNAMSRAMPAAAERGVAPVDAAGGLEVPEVEPDSRLDAAGIEEGDRILAVNGVSVRDAGALPRIQQMLLDGQPKSVDLDREGSPTRLSLPSEALADLVQELEAAD